MKSRLAKITAAVLAGCVGTACSPRSDAQFAHGDAHAAAAQGPDSTERGSPDVAHIALEATQATRQAANEVKRAAQTAAEQATDKVSDAMITTAVNAELARDAALGSLRIDVDTDAGRVALRGTAPDEQVRSRAAQIASQVQGVVSVENHITVLPNS
jgi:osmotically-inducible protein OsmY